MPELPEVETVVRQLAPILTGRRILATEILDEKLIPPCEREAFRDALHESQIRRVFRLGKHVVLELAKPEGPMRYVGIHLRMTGRLFAGDEETVRTRGALRAVLILDKGALGFSDTRRFGTFRLSDDPSTFEPKGVDPTGEGFTFARLSAMLKGNRQTLKPWLLRQDRLSGLGNIYACEILFESRLSPFRTGASLNDEEAERLRKTVRAVLLRAIRHCGTTFRDFQDSKGEIGSYQTFLRVYARENEPCSVCGEPVRRISQQGRSTYYCPRCQSAFEDVI